MVQVHLTAVTDANNGGGSRIVLQDGRSQRILTSGAATPIPGHGGGVTCECALPPADETGANFHDSDV